MNLELVDDACVLYCERFMEFLIDLLSQLPTRRYADMLVSHPLSLGLHCHVPYKLFSFLFNVDLCFDKNNNFLIN